MRFFCLKISAHNARSRSLLTQLTMGVFPNIKKKTITFNNGNKQYNKKRIQINIVSNHVVPSKFNEIDDWMGNHLNLELPQFFRWPEYK